MISPLGSVLVKLLPHFNQVFVHFLLHLFLHSCPIYLFSQLFDALQTFLLKVIDDAGVFVLLFLLFLLEHPLLSLHFFLDLRNFIVNNLYLFIPLFGYSIDLRLLIL